MILISTLDYRRKMKDFNKWLNSQKKYRGKRKCKNR